MRDKARIDRITKDLATIWAKNPDLRLGQLICNISTYTALYYMEDAQLMSALMNFYGVTLDDLTKTVQPATTTAEETVVTTTEAIKKKEVVTLTQKNEKNSKVFVHKENTVKVIAKEELLQYLADGWLRGRK